MKAIVTFTLLVLVATTVFVASISASGQDQVTQNAGRGAPMDAGRKLGGHYPPVTARSCCRTPQSIGDGE